MGNIPVFSPPEKKDPPAKKDDKPCVLPAPQPNTTIPPHWIAAWLQ
jgi:hypothetical protein